MKCNNCGTLNEHTAKFCGDCGELLEIQQPATSTKRKGLVLVFALMLAVGFGFGMQQYLSTDDAASINGNSSTSSASANREKKDIIKDAQQKVYTILTEDGLGSGFLFSKDGMVVTNAHVVAGYSEVMVRNIDGDEYPGEVIGISDTEDIALIRVEAFEGFKPLPGENDITDVGSEVIALGSPNGFENSASIGYLTGVDRDIEFDFIYEDVYQIDAQIAPGSSGGPLIDAESGRVIGINSLLYTDGNEIGFSIPLYSVQDSLEEWANQPMSSTEVAALFGVYSDSDSYSDESDGYEEEEVEDENSALLFDEEELYEFLSDFQTYFEMALSEEDLYYVEDLLVYNSPAYYETADFIDQVAGQDLMFDFIDLQIQEVEGSDSSITVRTYESFDFMNIYGEWSFEEQYKTYTILVDEYGDYYVENIE